MIDAVSLRNLSERKLLSDFSSLVERDRRQTARMLAYIGEIDRRKLYLEHAYPSMFAFCTGRFRMSESMAAKRIRTARTACSFPRILKMIGRGELHLSGAYRLAPHLTTKNYRRILQRAKHLGLREIEKLVAELAPKPDVKASLRALPIPRAGTVVQGQSAAGSGPHGNAPTLESRGQLAGGSEGASHGDAAISAHGSKEGVAHFYAPAPSHNKRRGRMTPLSPRRYRLQVTIGEEGRDTLTELQGLLSHQIPNGDPAAIVERALALLLTETKKKKAALTKKPRASTQQINARPTAVAASSAHKGRTIPAKVRRQVFNRDGGRCAYRDAKGRRCASGWQVEFHHRVPYAKGGSHSVGNIEIRCRAHNQRAAELDFGKAFMAKKTKRARAPTSRT